MSRSRRSRINNLSKRNYPTITRVQPLFRRNVLPLNLNHIEDNRLYRPRISTISNAVRVSRPLRTTQGRVAKLRFGINFRNPFGHIVHAPLNAILCVRRKIRREVLFAKGGAGGRASRVPKRFNRHSHIRC